MKKSRRKYLKFFTLANIILLVVNIVSYCFLTGPTVFQTQAAEFTITVGVQTEPSILPQCSDGIDNDGDGLIDYPADPGCSSPDDEDEYNEPIIPPPPPPPPPPNPGNGNYNPPIIQPIIPQQFPVWLNIAQVNNQYLDELAAPYQFTDTSLTFKGQTNVNNAIIFIQLNDQPNVIYTTWAVNGFWQWFTPYILNLGNYQLYVWAINPADPTIMAEQRLDFAIVSQILPPPVIPPVIPPVTPPSPTTTPPVIIPPVTPPPTIPPTIPSTTTPPMVIVNPPIVPKEVYQSSKEFYNLSIKVTNKNKQVYPKDKIGIKTDLIKLKPADKKDIVVNYKIKNNEGKVVWEGKRRVAVEKESVETFYLQSSFNLKPGKYSVESSVERDKKIFIANDYFEVAAKPLIIGRTELAMTQQELAQNLIIGFFILFTLLIFFTLLHLWEYYRSQKQKPISEEDLEKNDYLDIE